MNINTGEIKEFTKEQMEAMNKAFFKTVDKKDMTEKQLQEMFVSAKDHRSKLGIKRNAAIRKIGRNNPCPCGSGRKYKKCCLHVV